MWNIRIVLVEPTGALNLGSVARVMKNMGLSQLWLVNPQCDRLGAEARLMAVHAPEILENAQVVQNLPQALFGCQRAIATAGRIDAGELTLHTPTEALTWLTEWLINSPAGAATEGTIGAIVFGTEDRGLSNAELQYCHRILTIPTAQIYPSLNLAQAVSICCYHLQLLWQAQQAMPQQPIDRSSQANQDLLKLAPIEAVEAYYNQLEILLLEIGYLHPHTAFSRMQKLRQLFNKADLTESEVTMLRGVLRQVQWHHQQV